MAISAALPNQQQNLLGQWFGPNVGSFAGNLTANPLFMAGLTGLAGHGPGVGAQMAQATQQGRMQQSEWERQQAERQRLQRVWGEAFPEGRANAEHPLLRGMPPELASVVAAMGPEQGIPLLGKYSLANAEMRQRLNQELALARQKMGLEREAQLEKIRMLEALYGGGGTGPTAPAAAEAAPMPPAEIGAVPGIVVAPPDPNMMAPPMGGGPAAAAPAPAAAPVAADPGAPDPRRLAAGRILFGKDVVAPFEAQFEPYYEGQKELAKERAKGVATKERAAESARTMLGFVDQLEQAADALGGDRLNSALNPDLDTWFGQNVQRRFQPQAYNDRRLMQSYIDNIIVQARETQRGLGPLTEGEQATLERAYAGVKSATTPEAFRAHLDTIRSVLYPKMGRQFQPGWVRKGLQERERIRRTPMKPPKGEGTRETDDLSAVPEGTEVYDRKTGQWGRVINGRFVPESATLGNTFTGAP